jgi:outer membrane protein
MGLTGKRRLVSWMNTLGNQKMNYARLACAAALAGVCAAAQAQTPAAAAPGFSAGDIVVRLGAGAVLPMDAGSGVSLIGGSVHATNSVSPEADISYFFSDHFAIQLIAASTRHDLYVSNSILGPRVDIGSTYVLPPALTLQYHPLPHERISPYVGFGLDMAFFYDSNPNHGPIDKIRLSNTIGPVFDVGVDYNIYGPFFLNVDYKQILLRTDATIRALGSVIIHAHDELNPGVPSVGVEYRF